MATQPMPDRDQRDNREPHYDFDAEFSQDSTTVETIGTRSLAAINSSEINQMITTALAHPRSVTQFRKSCYNLITQDQEMAAACIYALPRGKVKNPETGNWEKKVIKGPSARFAEIIAYAWKNCRVLTRIVDEDQSFITAQGVFFDLEQNVALQVDVKRRITDHEGNRYNDDLIGVTSNAASSIALRNAVLKGIPKAFWKGLYLAAEKTIMGDIKTLNDRRQQMIDLFKPFALTSPELCELLGVEGVSEIVGDDLITLQGFLTALREGETTVEQLRAEARRDNQRAANRGRQTVENIKAQYAKADSPSGTTENPQPSQQVNMDAEPPQAAQAATPGATGDQGQHRGTSPPRGTGPRATDGLTKGK